MGQKSSGVLMRNRRRRVSNANPRNEIRAVVRGVLQHVQEQKRQDAAIATTDLVTAGLVQPITQHIIQGDSLSTRDGSAIILRELDIIWHSLRGGPVVGAPALYRIIIFVDTMNTGVLPAVTDVLQAADPRSGYNVANLVNGRFKFLVDEHIATVSETVTENNIRRYRLKLNKKVTYLGSTFTTASNGKNSVWCLTITDISVAVTTQNTLNFALHFTDS